MGQWNVDQDQDYPRNNRDLAVGYDLPPLPSFEKRRNRIPLVWKGLNKEERKEKHEVDFGALRMFFQRMAPIMSKKMKQLKINKV